MGLKFRKSFKVAPGVRMNIGKRGVSTSIGGKGGRVNFSSRGVSVGTSIPGTGISYNKRIVGSRNKRPQRTNYERIKQQQEREIAKANQLQQDKYEVDKFESHIEMLTSVHEEVSDTINWEEVAELPRPFSENEDGPNVMEIKDTLSNYKPSWRDKLFNRKEAKIKHWESQIPNAEQNDIALIKKWEDTRDIADRMILKNFTAMEDAIEQIYPFEDIIDLGSTITYEFDPNGDRVSVRLNVENKNAIPEQNLSLTKTGKLSRRAMPKGKYFQLYQDYVCSCVLRIAREFFAITPVDQVKINVYDEATADDNTDFGCILSANIYRNQIKNMEFNNIDCSDTIELFEHNMKFLKTKGFKFIEEV
ncbi:DUF4236 domain-containing protein [Gracilibacillus xinjiangensis]|uniref:DUF4236 domain-containing protein n=1 Tax=Gracilibacillus xinjiangensis TaxID=1193282 RepID=A0ABV8WTT1_9BACI